MSPLPAIRRAGTLCIDCDGSGRYPSGAPCKSCGGSGRVLEGDGFDWSAIRREEAERLRRQMDAQRLKQAREAIEANLRKARWLVDRSV